MGIAVKNKGNCSTDPSLAFVGPGLNVAQTSLWIACAMSLAVFDIEKYVDESGNVVEPKIHYSDGSTRQVLIY